MDSMAAEPSTSGGVETGKKKAATDARAGSNKKISGARTDGGIMIVHPAKKQQAIALMRQQQQREKELAIAVAAGVQKVGAEAATEHRRACLLLELFARAARSSSLSRWRLLSPRWRSDAILFLFSWNTAATSTTFAPTSISRDSRSSFRSTRKHLDNLLTAINLRSQTLFEVLMFPAPKETRSRSRLDKILGLLRSARHALHVSIYVLSHEEVADALIEMASSSWGVSVTVIVDYPMMLCTGSKVKDLVAVGIAVYVAVRTTYMMHHKYVVVDERVAMHGSVNFSHHALGSAGIVTIHDDRRMLDPLIADGVRGCRGRGHVQPPPPN
ncbi:hypothetical protein Gpo141_00010627 [Globisporangium polare]